MRLVGVEVKVGTETEGRQVFLPSATHGIMAKIPDTDQDNNELSSEPQRP